MNKSSIIDIISPIMAGPSSSHTAGAVRLGLLAGNIYNGKPSKIIFRLYNSYAQTGKGHGTDKGLLAGILGFSVSDERIKNVFETPEAQELNYEFEYLEDFNRHPNSVDFIFEGNSNMFIRGNSVGAGEVEIVQINDFYVNLDGKYNSLILMYKDKPGVISETTGIIQQDKVNIASLHCDRSAKGKTATMCIALDGELSQSSIQKICKMNGIQTARYVRKLES